MKHTDQQPNEAYLAVQKIFADPGSLHYQSNVLARRLYDLASHPQIKAGDFYVSYMNDVLIDDEMVNAVGIYKAETKDHFLKLKRFATGHEISLQEGTYIGKLDKGCLIYETDVEEGYRVAIVDRSNKTDAHYWKDAFLGLEPCADNYHHTQEVMGIARSFLDQLPMEFEVERPDQIDMMNRSLEYFKSHQHFDESDFAEEVFKDVDVAEAFGDFTANYRNDRPGSDMSGFELDEQAVKKQSRHFKSVLKLDRNFHVYIHGDRSMIQRGEDADGRKYYKLYYSVES